VKVGWGKPSNIPHEILNAVGRGATRNVYIGNISDSVNKQFLIDGLSSYGTIDCVTILPEKRCAFVSFTSILSAIKVNLFSLFQIQPTTETFFFFKKKKKLTIST